MSDLFQEISHELRQEKIVNLWKKYQVFIFVLIALIIGSTAAYVTISNKNFDSQNADSKIYYSAIKALDSENNAFAEEKLVELSKSSNIGYKILSLFRLSAMKTNDKNYEEAKKYYKQIIDSNHKFKNLFYLAEFNLNKINFVQNNDISYDKNNKFLPLILELEIINDINNKNFSQANIKIDNLLLSNDLPDNLQNRINLLKSKIPNE